MTRSRTRRWPIALVAMMAVLSGAGCGKAAGGPLQTVNSQGQPYVAISSFQVRPGQSWDAEAYVFNSANGPVQVTGVAAVPVTDEPEGRLVHVGLLSTGAGAAGGGWPPGVPVIPPIGAEIPPGLTGIIFAMAGSAADHDYAVAGLRIEYEYRGRGYATIAWDGDAVCVYGGRNRHADDASCTAFGNKVSAIVEDMSGLS